MSRNHKFWEQAKLYFIRNYNRTLFPIGAIAIILLIIVFGTNQLKAQNVQTQQDNQLEPLRSGVKLYDFAGSLRWQTYYYQFHDYTPDNGIIPDHLKRGSQSILQVQFRNIFLLSSHVGLGYKAFTTVYMKKLFKDIGVGGIGGGPILRIYPLKSRRWQPYLQGSFVAGYNLALRSGGIASYNGMRFRTSLRAGLDYKLSNNFGIFFEIGPKWEYVHGMQLVTHALQIDVGIELFRF